MKTLKIIGRIGKAIFAPELLQVQKAYADSIEQYQQTIEEMDLQFDDLMHRCKDAEEALQEKDKEIERLKAELNQLPDATKKVEAPADEWAGFVPAAQRLGRDCSPQCKAFEHSYHHCYCKRYQKYLTFLVSSRVPECIKEHGMEPDGEQK